MKENHVFLTLNHILQLEERALIILDKEKFTADFNELVQLENLLSKLEKITDMYFINVKEYVNHLKGDNLNSSELKSKINEYNNKLLNTKIQLFPSNQTEWGIIQSFIDFNKEEK